jgi:hypothetical protein
MKAELKMLCFISMGSILGYATILVIITTVIWIQKKI